MGYGKLVLRYLIYLYLLTLILSLLLLYFDKLGLRFVFNQYYQYLNMFL